MQIFIKTLTGKTIRLDIDKSQKLITGSDIKKLIEEKEGIPFDGQKIISCGKEWPDSWTESDMRKQYSAESRDVGLSEVLHLIIIKRIPEHLRSLSKMNYQELKTTSVDLACEISQTTRTLRYSQTGRPDTEAYWNSIGEYKRAALLDEQNCSNVISSLPQVDETSVTGYSSN